MKSELVIAEESLFWFKIYENAETALKIMLGASVEGRDRKNKRFRLVR